MGEQNLKKYQEESTNVSNVSVSRIAFFPVDFCLVIFQVGWASRGLPWEFKFISSGLAKLKKSIDVALISMLMPLNPFLYNAYVLLILKGWKAPTST